VAATESEARTRSEAVIAVWATSNRKFDSLKARLPRLQRVDAAECSAGQYHVFPRRLEAKASEDSDTYTFRKFIHSDASMLRCIAERQGVCAEEGFFRHRAQGCRDRHL